MITRALPHSPLPAGAWAARTDWQISSIDEVVAVRGAAREIVGPDGAVEPSQPVFASAGARVEAAMGELVINGLRHGDPPVHASLFRGGGGWLLVVSDSAAGQAPLVIGKPTGKTAGGLGVRLVVAVATDAGWYADSHGKHVWVLIGDEPPAHLLAALGPGPA